MLCECAVWFEDQVDCCVYFMILLMIAEYLGAHEVGNSSRDHQARRDGGCQFEYIRRR